MVSTASDYWEYHTMRKNKLLQLLKMHTSGPLCSRGDHSLLKDKLVKVTLDAQNVSYCLVDHAASLMEFTGARPVVYRS